MFILTVCSTPSPALDRPLTYRIGAIDKNFSLSREELSNALKEASLIWEKSIGRRIFQEGPGGEIVINLVYDRRQAHTDSMKAISSSLNDTKASYDALMDRYNTLKEQVSKKSAAYESAFRSYSERLNAYNASIESASTGDDFTEDMHKRFLVQRLSLDTQLADLNSRQQDLNNTVDTLNEMVALINEVSASHNTQAANLMKTSMNLSGEFNAGLYERDIYGERITVYHFSDYSMLVRTLAHELGHAMGLKHNNNPQSIMYYLNRSRSVDLSPEDISAMQARCGAN